MKCLPCYIGYDLTANIGGTVSDGTTSVGYGGGLGMLSITGGGSVSDVSTQADSGAVEHRLV